MVSEKSVKYDSDHEPNRYRKIEIFAQNNWQLLKEEMDFAAETNAARLVEGLVRRAE